MLSAELHRIDSPQSPSRKDYNVMVILASSEFGGAERILLDWITHLPNSIGIVVVLPDAEGRLVQELTAAGINFYTVGLMRPRHLPQLLRRLFAIIDTEKIDLVHSNLAGGHLLGGMLHWLAGLPELWFVHGLYGTSGLLQLARFLPATVAATGCRHYLQDSSHSIIARHHWLCPLGVDLARFAPSEAKRTSTRRRLNLEDSITILMHGRIDPFKGVDVFLDALAEVCKRLPNRMNLQALIVGAPLKSHRSHQDFAQGLQRQADRLNLRDRVRFIDWTADIADYLNAADIVVQCSTIPEGFCLTVTEALAVGAVVVATDEGGPRDQVEHGISGFSIPPRDPAILARTLLEIIAAFQDDRPRIQQIKQNAHATARARYSIGTSAARLNGMYATLLSDRTSPVI